MMRYVVAIDYGVGVDDATVACLGIEWQNRLNKLLLFMCKELHSHISSQQKRAAMDFFCVPYADITDHNILEQERRHAT